MVLSYTVFPVVMFGCESWTMNKAEHQRIDAFKVMLEMTLESFLDCKEIKPINPRGPTQDGGGIGVGRPLSPPQIHQKII